MRYSRQRELIYNIIMNNRMHPTADMVYAMLKSENPDLSLGTVYRNLNQLAENGDIIKIEVLDGNDRYDAKSAPHFHMICTCCNKIYDIPFNVVSDNIAENVFSKTNHRIEEYDIAFKGICKNCIEKGE